MELIPHIDRFLTKASKIRIFQISKLDEILKFFKSASPCEKKPESTSAALAFDFSSLRTNNNRRIASRKLGLTN